jgi:signal transduction histidine kinase
VTRRLLASYLALTVVALAALEIPLAIVNARNERQDLTAKVERDAFAAASLAEDRLQAGTGRSPALQALARGYRRDTGGRIVIVDRRGRSLADSHPTVPGETQFATRPEIEAALSGLTATGIRRSRTLGAGLLYVAVPVASNGVVHGAVRITYPTSELDVRVRRYRLALLAVAGLVLAAACAVGVLLARSVTRPLRRVEEAASRVGGGDLAARAPEDAGPPEVRRLARELNDTTGKLAALLHSQEQFVADASHELRSPLTALRLRLENLEPVPEAALQEMDRLGRVVDELLALARADAEPSPPTAVDVADVTRRRVEIWQAFAGERGVRLEATGGEARAQTATGRLEQVLDNLLANALDVAPRGSVVRVEVARSSAWVELHVIDHGPGLSPEGRDRAFDRFWRGHGGRGGSGLGLSIAKRLVTADGGEIELRAAPGSGIDAVVRLRPLR